LAAVFSTCLAEHKILYLVFLFFQSDNCLSIHQALDIGFAQDLVAVSMRSNCKWRTASKDDPDEVTFLSLEITLPAIFVVRGVDIVWRLTHISI
jgi:hypothetical protein